MHIIVGQEKYFLSLFLQATRHFLYTQFYLFTGYILFDFIYNFSSQEFSVPMVRSYREQFAIFSSSVAIIRLAMVDSIRQDILPAIHKILNVPIYSELGK